MNSDKLILEAALGDKEPAFEAWRNWFAAGNLDLLPGASIRLMPLVHANLARHGYSGGEVARLKGIRRKLWVEGEQRIFNALPYLKHFSAEFGRLILLKGAPLAALYYKDFGLRPMSDLDVLVEEHSALKLMHFLLGEGWTMVIHPQPRKLDEEFLTFRHGAGFKGPNGVEIDVHWRLSYFGTRPGIDSIVREAAEPFDLRGFPAWTLCPTDHLFHAMLHGIQYNPYPASRWVADAIYLLRNPRGIDFRRLEKLAAHYNVAPYIALAANVLRRDFAVPFPDLNLLEPGWWLRQELRRETSNWFTTPKPIVVAATLHRYARTGASWWNLPRLARYCQFQWDLTTAEGWQGNLRRVTG